MAKGPSWGRRDGVLDVVRFLTGTRHGWLLAVAENYLLFGDESGTHDQAVGTLLAGYLARIPSWEHFRPRCLQAHRTARLRKPFHMTDYVRRPRHPDYAHLSDSE